MTSLVPAYLRTAYKTDPLFENAKVVYSMYENSLETSFDDTFLEKASINNITPEDLASYKGEDGVTLHKGAVTNADGVIVGSENLPEDMKVLVSGLDKPVLDFQEGDNVLEGYMEFYNNLLAEAEV